jgi:hypothetical protein
MSYRVKRKKNPILKRPAYQIASGIAAIVIIVAGLEVSNTTHIFHKSPVPPVIPTETSQSSAMNSNQSTTAQPSPPANDKTTGSPIGGDNNSGSTASTSSSLPLKAPEGSFVSNHYPGTEDSSYDEVSNCITTPGATCYIRFTNGSSTTKLPAKITNDNGVASWSWDIEKAELTKGLWKITAVATLNGQTKSTEDQTPLTVK